MTRKWKNNQTTSKIYKLYINGKTKRPGTHRYPYLGPKVVVVAGKLDPTVNQICFHRIFQTVMNLEKRTTGMSSEGPKMMGERYGSAWNGRKMAKSDDPRCRQPPRLPVRSGRPVAVGSEISRRRSSGGGTPPCPALAQGWWPESAPTAKTRMT